MYMKIHRKWLFFYEIASQIISNYKIALQMIFYYKNALETIFYYENCIKDVFYYENCIEKVFFFFLQWKLHWKCVFVLFLFTVKICFVNDFFL